MYWIAFVVGWMVALAVLIPGAARLERRYPTVRTWPDRVLGGVAVLAVLIVVTLIANQLWPHRPTFVRGALSGAVVGAVAFLPDIVAALRHRRRPTPRPLVRPVVAGRPSVPPVGFADAVHRHFAEPTVRARYVIAAYRRGLIAPGFVAGLASDLAPLLPDGVAWAGLTRWQGGDGLDDAVDRAAREIGFVPSDEEERDEVVERLVYWALCSDDPRLRRDVLELLGHTVEPRTTFEEVGFRPARVSALRALLQGYFEAAHGERLSDGVHRHFTDPIVQAQHVIAAYRWDMVGAAGVVAVAADVLSILPGAGDSWTELAMASPTAWKSDLAPIVERAAAEIGFAHEEDVELLIENELYRALVDGDVLERSKRIYMLDDTSPFGGPWIMVGHDADVSVSRFFTDGHTLLNQRYQTLDPAIRPIVR